MSRFISNKLAAAGILLLFMAAWYVSAFWYQLMLLQGASMEPSYHSGQFLVLDKHTGVYNYGDVIAFRKDGVKGLLVKRIAAVPGDTVSIRDGVLYINGEVPEEWKGRDRIGFAGIAGSGVDLGETGYFVLGDNISESRDSRYGEIGIVLREEIVGKVLWGKR